MYTKKSAIKTLFKAPIGKDIMDLLMYMTDINPLFINNPIVGNIKLRNLPKLTKGLISDSFLDGFIEILNREPELIECNYKETELPWWKSAVFYQIYPISFKDSNDDGIGDLKGILEKLDYLQDIGIDALWLSPVYDSPFDDNGYDIRDYEKIMEQFGSMQDFDNLMNAVHERGMKLIMDLVINHTSDEHEWFKQALKDPESKYRDYYIFKEPKDGGPPNNWTSAFKGSAWNYYPEQDIYALHVFSSKQMDLNWENEEMRKDIYKMINFWLEKGIDGFRLDVINLISKAPGLPDGEEALSDLLGAVGYEHMFYGPKLHEYLQEMHKETFGKHNAFTIGEGAGIGMQGAKMLTCPSRPELDQIFNFDQLNNPGKTRFDKYDYDLRKLKPLIIKWQTGFGGNYWPANVFENHDTPRIVSKITKDPKYRDYVSKLVSTLMMTLRGTPYFYQGQEIGMIDKNFKTVQELKDVEAINMYNEKIQAGLSPEEAMSQITVGTRDNARIPMQWADLAYAGFSNVKPWIDSSNDYMKYNVQAQLEDDGSILNYFKKLTTLRRKHIELIKGDFVERPDDADMLCFSRVLKEENRYEECYIEMNLTQSNKKRIKQMDTNKYDILLSNYKDTSELLRPYEVIIYKKRIQNKK